MSQLIAMFCDIDDFCKWFEPLYMPRLLQNSQRHRVCQGHLTLSELMTIIVYFHRSALLLVLLPNQTTAILRGSDTATRHHPDLSLHLRMVATGLESGGTHRSAAAYVRLRGRPTPA
jgi:hypothetical protein